VVQQVLLAVHQCISLPAVLPDASYYRCRFWEVHLPGITSRNAESFMVKGVVKRAPCAVDHRIMGHDETNEEG